MEAIVFVILQIFLATRAVLKIGEYQLDIGQFKPGNIQSRDAFRPIARERKYLMDYNNACCFVITEICSVAPQNRQGCGKGSKEECENRGCCYNSSIRGVPWCFYGNP